MTVTPTPVADPPLDEFSNCHRGILNQLDSLGGLPALLAPAAEARRIAAEALQFFGSVVYQHHAEEERDLFPAVLASARTGVEHDQVQGMVDRLLREHREVEAAWERLEPQLEAVANGQHCSVDVQALQLLAVHYKDHADYEEALFLPLSKIILSRNGDHMAALGMSLHMRRTLPGVMERFGHRI